MKLEEWLNMRVKICGITNLEDALCCISNGADALGFIFYNESKRYIRPEEAKEIISLLPPFVVKVGVFVNQEALLINDIAKTAGLDAVQLHGDEGNDICSNLNLPVIKSFRVDISFDYSILKQFLTSYHLLDAYSSKEFGGTGQLFDWTKIPHGIRNKIILAGGISSDNIEFVFKSINPAAVDLSSSLEEYPGKKDNKKVMEFFNKINKMRYKQC